MSERRFDPAKLAKLENPERRKALPPEKLLESLEIGEYEDILDLGAGTGYFTIPAAQLTKGKVYALDVEPMMIDVLKERVQEQGLENVEYVQGVIEDIPLQDSVADHIIASFVLHEVEPLSKGLQEIYRTLKENGTCFCLEWEKVESEQGPPLHHRIHSTDMEEAMKKEGFQIVSKSFPTAAHYVLIARK